MKTAGFLLLLFIAACGDYFCQEQYGVNIIFNKISEEVIVVSGSQFSTNQVGINSGEGIILIDTGISPGYAALIKDSLSKFFGTNEFAYVINTHHHWDHVQGNQAFAGTNIIAHINCETGMRSQRPAQILSETDVLPEDDRLNRDSIPPPPPSHILVDGENGYSLTIPSITFNDRMIIRVGRITLKIFYYGECHTDNDIIIYIPEEKLLAVGDLFFKNSLPQIGSRRELDVDKWLNVLNRILQNENPADYIISGHNEIFTKPELQEYYEYLKILTEGIKKEISNKKSIEDIKIEFSLKEKFPRLLNKDMISSTGLSLHNGNIEKLYNYFILKSGSSR